MTYFKRINAVEKFCSNFGWFSTSSIYSSPSGVGMKFFLLLGRDAPKRHVNFIILTVAGPSVGARRAAAIENGVEEKEKHRSNAVKRIEQMPIPILAN